jgi:hypothetical protein
LKPLNNNFSKIELIARMPLGLKKGFTNAIFGKKKLGKKYDMQMDDMNDTQK